MPSFTDTHTQKTPDMDNSNADVSMFENRLFKLHCPVTFQRSLCPVLKMSSIFSFQLFKSIINSSLSH